MISSPCKSCLHVDEPKTHCMATCLLLQQIQAKAAEEVPAVAMTLDYSESDYPQHGLTGLPAGLLA